MRPLLLVDFDGVLNPYAAAVCPPGFVEYDLDVFPGEEPVRLNAAHGRWLRELATRFDLAWASACAEDLNQLCAPLLGLDPMPRVPMPPPPFDPELKVPAIHAFVGDRAVAWLDDLFGDAARTWAAERSEPTLLVDVDPAVGLTEPSIAELLEWHRQLQDTRTALDPVSVEDAIALAARAHRGQRYSSPEREPYVFHPLRIMLRFDDPPAQIAAVLHDAIEDTAVEVDDLVEAGYSAEVIDAIECLTHRDGESYEGYIGRVAGNELARRVKIEDLNENLANNRRSPSNPGNAERIERYRWALARLGAPDAGR